MNSNENVEKITYPLHKVIRCRNIHKIKILLPLTKDINKKNEMGYSPLLYACEQEDNDEMLELLFEQKGIDPLSTDNEMQNVLHILAFKGQFNWIKKFFEKFPNMPVDEVTIKGDTPLIMATKMDRVDIIQYLHDKHANVNHANEKKFTALHYAANNGYINSAKKLLELGAEINAKDDHKCTPLIKSSSWNFLETTKFLVQNGADLEAKDGIGNTSLTQANRRGYIEIVKYLLENGANPNIVTNKTEYNIYYTPVITACKRGDVGLLKILIKYNADVNIPGSYSQALFTCIKMGFVDGVVELLKANVNLLGKHHQNNKTPLQYAIKFKQTKIADLIRRNL